MVKTQQQVLKWQTSSLQKKDHGSCPRYAEKIPRLNWRWRGCLQTPAISLKCIRRCTAIQTLHTREREWQFFATGTFGTDTNTAKRKSLKKNTGATRLKATWDATGDTAEGSDVMGGQSSDSGSMTLKKILRNVKERYWQSFVPDNMPFCKIC